MRKVEHHLKLSGLWMVSAFLVFSCSFSAEAFTLISNGGKPAYWPGGNITYHFNSHSSGQFAGGHDASGTSTDEFAPIRAAFQTWQDLSGLNLNFTEAAMSGVAASSGDYQNTISWVTTGWSSQSYRPPSNALAVTLLSFNTASGAIIDADIYFNAQNFSWSVVDTGGESGYIDVQNIATHEIGHLIGLDHSSEDMGETDLGLKAATMFYAAGYGETSRRTPHADDIDAVQALYGVSPASAPTITSVNYVGMTGQTIIYQVNGTNFNDRTAFILTKNNPAISDAVARYKTINSSTNATVKFDLTYLTDGGAAVLAFNTPSQIANYSVELTGTGLGATSAGGGGGCVMSAESSFSPSFFVLFLALSVSILILRSRKLRSPSH
ncbi:MAG: matrixin family metalloprotease [Deltaproteobacteria bacterium]|nr:matrixin family metalloprotease [Deltaproteobacteria bacterium]